MLTPLEKARILAEAMPSIKRYHGKCVVIKLGGNVMINDELKKSLMEDVVLMKLCGIHPILVHGGGPEITTMLGKMGKKTVFVDGLRVTDAETMEITEMVLAGKINKEIVFLIHQCGGKAIGLSGKDGNLIRAKKRYAKVKKEEGSEIPKDLGFVGDVEKINPEIIEIVTAAGYIPVVAPVGYGPEGETYNINADYVAGEMAISLKADKLVILTDVKGIFADFSDTTSFISTIKASEASELIERGVISGGMIPKVQCCVRALQAGVSSTHIIDGRIPHSILSEIFIENGIGTTIVK
jgi:acetylglutamate kinase